MFAVVIVGAALVVLAVAVLSDPLGILVLPSLLLLFIVLIVAFYATRAAFDVFNGDERRF